LNKDEYICLLENINKFLESFLSKNKIKLEQIYQQNIIKKEYNFKGLYTYLLEDDKAGEVQKGVEEHILNWYHFLTGNPPMAQTILLCNEETSSEEITAFIYRAFKCQYNAVFMIGKIELLNPVKRQVLTGLVNSLFTGHEEEMKSCVAFVYSDKTSSIVQYLERIKGKKKLEHKNKKKGEKILYKENVEIIFSNKSGVGKSKYIEQNIKNNGKQYIYFPFGGEFNRKDVINRLKHIKIKNEEKAAIHLDLYDSKQTDLMKDFLYSFLITKLYGQNETLFYLSKKVEIKIEIPNGFINFFLKFPILSMFENKTEMKIENLPPLIIEEQINSNRQIVCNYLKLLKSGKISDKDLNIKNVSYEYIPEDERIQTKLDAVSLPQKECEDLIKEYIGIKYPTYYQINAFINALSGQLKKFSMIAQLNAGFLIENGNIINKPNLKKIREVMINGFIKNTQHFTQGAFEKLLNSQMDTYNVGVKHGEYKEDKQEEVAIQALSNLQEIINFDKIKPSLIFFHEGEGQEFSIITTNKPEDQEYKDLLELRRTPVILQNLVQTKKEKVPENLNNYISFKHKDFLKEIREILNIKNPIYNSDKNEQDKNLKSIEEIVGDYVFTADNFIKMILILLRIRENIPIIMMGETGCGKTSLIRKLSELINNGESKMKILNIHAGITDKEIYDFLNHKEKEADKNILEEADALQKKEEIKKKEQEELGFKYFEKKLWIFLDEINTCNSMGLICEMMTKHSCQGKPLPKNIVFIAACNPYRMVVKDEEPNGLKLKGVKERKLVYTVNPLPHSLLNFVFNFGNLTKKDEESYIKNMVVSPIESFYWKDLENNNENKIQQNNNENNIQENNYEENQKKKGLEFYLKKEIFDQYQKLLDMASNSIIEAQEYVREKNDVSSVSLREIRRFSIFYNFFVEYLRKKKKIIFRN
jgi:energy-coupling factor transporter ATP-binding protein EcfA2